VVCNFGKMKQFSVSIPPIGVCVCVSRRVVNCSVKEGVKMLTNGELEGIWKEALVSCLNILLRYSV